jgi:hypothetical protein
VTGPPGLGHVTTDIGSLGHDQSATASWRSGIGAVTSGSGQTVKPAPVTPARGGTAVHRVVPAQLACRVGARARAGEHDAWPAVVAIALGSFALVFSEVTRWGCSPALAGTWASRSAPAG